MVAYKSLQFCKSWLTAPLNLVHGIAFAVFRVVGAAPITILTFCARCAARTPHSFLELIACLKRKLKTVLAAYWMVVLGVGAKPQGVVDGCDLIMANAADVILLQEVRNSHATRNGALVQVARGTRNGALVQVG
tara:strand:- start:1211 stop:1612 length:402 start_codon:yes stop_codon:yes gene_type:complete